MTTDHVWPMEMMAVEIAHDLKDGQVGRIGGASTVPIAACFLAQHTHAPNLTFILASGDVNPKPRALYPSSLDERYGIGSEARLDFLDIFSEGESGSLDFFFYSGLQIDRWGNINLTHVGGTLEHPSLRGPGLPQISFAATIGSFYLFTLRHEPRVLVDRVDYVTAPGNLFSSEGRSAAGITTEGPRMCVTPKATFMFHSGEMRPRSRTPGVTPAELQNATGFPLGSIDDLPETPLPTPEELEILRKIDVDGLLRVGSPINGID